MKIRKITPVINILTLILVIFALSSKTVLFNGLYEYGYWYIYYDVIQDSFSVSNTNSSSSTSSSSTSWWSSSTSSSSSSSTSSSSS